MAKLSPQIPVVPATTKVRLALTNILKARPRVDLYALVILALPALVLFRDTNPIFTSVGTIDPWVYYGYFHNIVAYERDLFGSPYYGSRLSWILPGYIVNRLFSPIIANYVLHLAVYYTAVLALYSLLKSAADRRTALLGAMFFGFYPYLWASIGWDYSDGAGIAYCLLSLALLDRAASGKGGRGSLIGSGVAYAAMVYANITWVAFSPVFPFVLLNRAWAQQAGGTWRRLGEMTMWFGTGAVALTTVLALVKYRIQPGFWFYWPSIAFVIANLHQPNRWEVPVREWIGIAKWLILPAATLLISLVALIRQQGGRILVFCAQFLVAAGILLAMQLRGQPLLQFQYYASYLIPFCFLVIGSHLPLPAGLRERTFWIVTAMALLALALPWWFPMTGLRVALIDVPNWLLIAVLIAVLLGAVNMRRTLSVVTMTLAIGLTYIYFVASVKGLAPDASGHTFARVAQGIHEIEQVRGRRAIRFWYDVKEPFGGDFGALNSTYLWGYTWISLDFPRLPASVNVPPGTLLVVPSSRDDATSQAVNSYKQPGQTLRLLSRKIIEGGGGRYYLSMFEVVRSAS